MCCFGIVKPMLPLSCCYLSMVHMSYMLCFLCNWAIVILNLSTVIITTWLSFVPVSHCFKCSNILVSVICAHLETLMCILSLCTWDDSWACACMSSRLFSNLIIRITKGIVCPSLGFIHKYIRHKHTDSITLTWLLMRRWFRPLKLCPH